MIRVLVAEDSVTVRELLTDILESDPAGEIQVVGQAKNGVEAIELTERLRPGIVTMDVHMPLMDGFEATKEIMARVPTPIVIVSSSISGRDVEMSLNAMRAGALMVVAKPDNPQSPDFATRQGQLVMMVKAMSQVKVVRRWGHGASGAHAQPPHVPAARGGLGRARIVAIAASTGGPAALQRILSDLPRDFPAPILVVQHIATGFVAGFADWLNANCALRVKVAEHGEPAVKRTVFVAPDERHLGIEADGRVIVADVPAIGGFRPSGTYLFESAARAYGSAVAAVILTGMGSDGIAGLRAVKSAGGQVLAQDEETSVVYGMPREAVVAGVVNVVSSIADMPRWLAELTARGPQ